MEQIENNIIREYDSELILKDFNTYLDKQRINRNLFTVTKTYFKDQPYILTLISFGYHDIKDKLKLDCRNLYRIEIIKSDSSNFETLISYRIAYSIPELSSLLNKIVNQLEKLNTDIGDISLDKILENIALDKIAIRNDKDIKQTNRFYFINKPYNLNIHCIGRDDNCNIEDNKEFVPHTLIVVTNDANNEVVIEAKAFKDKEEVDLITAIYNMVSLYNASDESIEEEEEPKYEEYLDVALNDKEIEDPNNIQVKVNDILVFKIKSSSTFKLATEELIDDGLYTLQMNGINNSLEDGEEYSIITYIVTNRGECNITLSLNKVNPETGERLSKTLKIISAIEDEDIEPPYIEDSDVIIKEIKSHIDLYTMDKNIDITLDQTLVFVMDKKLNLHTEITNNDDIAGVSDIPSEKLNLSDTEADVNVLIFYPKKEGTISLNITGTEEVINQDGPDGVENTQVTYRKFGFTFNINVKENIEVIEESKDKIVKMNTVDDIPNILILKYDDSLTLEINKELYYNLQNSIAPFFECIKDNNIFYYYMEKLEDSTDEYTGSEYERYHFTNFTVEDIFKENYTSIELKIANISTDIHINDDIVNDTTDVVDTELEEHDNKEDDLTINANTDEEKDTIIDTNDTEEEHNAVQDENNSEESNSEDMEESNQKQSNNDSEAIESNTEDITNDDIESDVKEEIKTDSTINEVVDESDTNDNDITENDSEITQETSVPLEDTLDQSTVVDDKDITQDDNPVDTNEELENKDHNEVENTTEVDTSTDGSDVTTIKDESTINSNTTDNNV